MSAVSGKTLCSGAEECISMMHLQPKNREKPIRDCISRYAKPDTMCELLNWLIFRVKNAINAVFGKSQ
jgi:hypothetical protein